MKTLLIVDDHPVVLEGIQSILSRNGFKVLKATSAPSALSLAEQVENIDLFVVDLSLEKGNDGLTLVDNLRRCGFTQPVVVYTMHEELWNVSILLKADVQGILLKGDDINELVHAVQLVSEGKTYVSNSFDEKRREAMMTDGILSAKDIEVLRRLVDGLGNRDIAREMNISEKAVEYHRSNILKKLCSKTMLEATRRAISLGIVYLLALAIATPAALAADSPTTTPEPVDLGLSVLWADRNLGASSPSEAGGYYAFGETAEKEIYDWSTYVHCDGEIGTCHNIGVENISATEYDAAHVILGDGWRMPTAEEFAELTTLCTAANRTVDNIPYKVLTAPDGTELIFPLAGYMSMGRVLSPNINGVYYVGNFDFEVEDLSSEGLPDWVLIAPYYEVFDANLEPTLFMGSAHLGMSIRPVRDRSTTSGISAVDSDRDNAIRAIYTLDGRALADPGAKPAPGFYIIVRADGSAAKTIIR